MIGYSPKDCDLCVGDKVNFTNEYGLKFGPLTVIGFALPENQVGEQYIHINTDAPWFPVKREALELIRSNLDRNTYEFIEKVF